MGFIKDLSHLVKHAKSLVHKVFNPFPHKHGSRHISKQQLLRYFSEVTVSAYMSQSVQDYQVVSAVQEMKLNCRPLNGTNGQDFFEENDACRACYDSIIGNVSATLQMEQNQWKNNASAEIRLPFDRQMQDMINDMEGCGSSCKACVFQNNSQDAVVNVETQSTMNESELLNWQNAVDGTISQTLYSRKGVLSAIGKVLGTSSLDETVATIVNGVKSSISLNTARLITDQVNTRQTIQFQGGGSTLFEGASQEVVVNQAVDALLKSGFSEQLFTSQQWDELSKVYVKDTTLDSVGNALTNVVTGFSNLLTSTIGGVMIALLAVLGILTIVVIGLAIARARKTKRKT